MKDIPKAAGIIWYKSKEDFIKAHAIFTDAFLLPDTYEDFLIGFANAVRRIEDSGYVVVKAELDPETFPTWCKERTLNVDAKGREAFGHAAALDFLKKSGKL
jgi:hypothetical protein